MNDSRGEQDLPAKVHAARLDQIQILGDSVATFAARALPVHRTRALRARRPEFESAMHLQFAGQGWLGLLVPEACGGFGLGFAEAAVVIERLAAALIPEPFLSTAVTAAGLLVQAAASPERDRLIRQVIDGSEIPGVAWQDPAGAFPNQQAPFRMSVRNGAWSVDGESRFGRPGSGASIYLLSAVFEGQSSLVVIRSDAPGLDVASENQTDGTTLARLRTRHLAVSREAVLHLPPGALDLVFDQSLVMNAVELLAVCARMRLMTLEYLKTRVQFGRPIGSFQALQHRAVDLLIQEELARAVITEATAALDAQTDATARGALASRAKARAAHAARWIARESIQMHGGVGITDEYDLALYVNRALSLAPWLGNAAVHRLRHQQLNPPRANE